MTILCIETSTSVCSAAICKGGVPIKQMINKEGSNHARLLPLFIEELLSLAREQNLTIEAVALSEGPGSYTGLRIGTSMAKGLCYGLNVPLIPVPTLEVLCEAAKQRLEVRGKRLEENLLCPMIDARRMEVYAALYSAEVKGERLKEKRENRARAVVVESEESLLEGQRDKVQGTMDFYYFGDGAEKCREVLNKPNWHFIEGIVPEAQYLGALVDGSLSLVVGSLSLVVGEKIAYYEPFYLKEFVAAQSHVKGLV